MQGSAGRDRVYTEESGIPRDRDLCLSGHYGVYVSAGSACSTHKRTPSATLTSIALDKPLLESTVRISMSSMTTKEEIDDALNAISEIVPRLKRFTRK